jgi:hypothetical protein
MNTTTTQANGSDFDVVLSETGPVSLRQEDWPIIARATWTDAGDSAEIQVHENVYSGACLVAGFRRGSMKASTGFVVRTEDVAPSGAVDPHEFRKRVCRNVRRVGGVLRNSQLAEDCINTLPSVRM